MKKIKKTLILSIGSNLEDRASFIRKGVEMLQSNLGQAMAISPVYETPPLGFDASLSFYNCAISFSTHQPPTFILSLVQQIEKENKRTRTINKQRYESRTLDIDIIYYGSTVINEVDLIVPHAQRLFRKFVLQPIKDIHPEFIDPIEKRSITELLAASKDDSVLKKIHDFKY